MYFYSSEVVYRLYCFDNTPSVGHVSFSSVAKERDIQMGTE